MKRLPLCTAALLWAVAAGQGLGVAADAYCAPGSYAGRDSYGGAGVSQAGFASDMEDGAERYASGVESWWDDICDCVRERRLLGYKRLQKKHRKFLYPECPPYCSPTFGYHHTQWRPFPGECEYVWSSAPGEVVYPTPAAPPAMFVPPPAQLPAAPPEIREAPPYFPEEPPLIQPAEPAARRPCRRPIRRRFGWRSVPAGPSGRACSRHSNRALPANQLE
jgi:hypothetical protein